MFTQRYVVGVCFDLQWKKQYDVDEVNLCYETSVLVSVFSGFILFLFLWPIHMMEHVPYLEKLHCSVIVC
jgi:hypothetical protein